MALRQMPMGVHTVRSVKTEACHNCIQDRQYEWCGDIHVQRLHRHQFELLPIESLGQAQEGFLDQIIHNAGKALSLNPELCTPWSTWGCSSSSSAVSPRPASCWMVRTLRQHLEDRATAGGGGETVVHISVGEGLRVAGKWKACQACVGEVEELGNQGGVGHPDSDSVSRLAF